MRKKPSVTATLIVHTTYRNAGSKKERSGYGRGTTREDKRHRNTSAAFHEWCHREDCVPSDIKRYSHEQTDEIGIPTQSKYLEDRKKRRRK